MGVTDRKSEQVYRWLLQYIDENKFSEHDRLPSEHALCLKFSVSRDTVRTALKRLEQENLILRRKGSGTYLNKQEVLPRELESGAAPMKIGLILQGQDTGANAEVIAGVRSILPEERCSLRIFLTDNKFSNERTCLQTVIHQNFSGFIVDGVKASMLNPNLDCYAQLYRRRIPVIFYNNYYKNLRYPRVIINDTLCAELLLQPLIDAGHRHIAGIFVYDNYQSIEKFQGMVATLQKNHLDFQDDYIKLCISNEAHDPAFVRSVERFLRSVPKCTAIVCCNYMIYRHVRSALEKMGKTVPEDYSLVCFDYSHEDVERENIYCSIQQGKEQGIQLAKRLLLMIERRDCEDRDYTIVLRPKIHPGTSIRKI